MCDHYSDAPEEQEKKPKKQIVTGDKSEDADATLDKAKKKIEQG